MKNSMFTNAKIEGNMELFNEVAPPMSERSDRSPGKTPLDSNRSNSTDRKYKEDVGSDLNRTMKADVTNSQTFIEEFQM